MTLLEPERLDPAAEEVLGGALDPHLLDALAADPLASSSLGGERADQPLAGKGLLRTTLTSWSSLRFTPYGLTPALMLGLIQVIQNLDKQAFDLAGPTLVRERGLSIGQLLSVLTYVGLVGTFASLAIGIYCDRHRRIPILALGTIISGISGAFTGVVRGPGPIGTARAFDDGIGTAGDTPLFSLTADYYPPEARGRAFSLLSSMTRFGAVAAIIVFAALFTVVGIQNFFLALGGLLVVTGVLTLVVLREPGRGTLDRLALGASQEAAEREEEPESFGEAWRSTFAVRTVRRIFVAEIFFGWVGAVGVLNTLWLADVYHLSQTTIALFFLPQILINLVAGSMGGGLIDRLLAVSPSRALGLFAAATSTTALVLVFQGLQPPVAVVLVVISLSGIGTALTGPALRSVYSQVIPPTSRTVKLQITGLSVVPTYIIALPLVGIIQFKYGYAADYYVAIPFAILSTVLFATAGQFFAVDRRNAVAATMAAEEHRQSVAEGTNKQLICRGVDVSYGDVQVLFGVDFEVQQGEIIALLGTNGAGKSTLLRAIAGTQQASGGAIVFDGRDITAMPPYETARRGIVLMPGGKGTFPGLTVRDNLLLGCFHDDPDRPTPTRIAEVLEIFPALAGRLDDEAGLLSGGEQQQLSLALAFLLDPKLLMIDELSLGLSPVVVGQLLEVVREINRRGVTVIVVEQSVNVALQLAERAVFMEKGEMRFVGSTADLMARPDILRAVYVKGTGALTSAAPRRDVELSRAPVLELVGLRKAFGGKSVLTGFDLTLHRGESLGVIGPNGSGKTTMFDIASGFLPADGGSVLLNGLDVTRLSPEARANRGLVRRFQDARLFPTLTVFETLLVSLEKQLEVKNTFVTALALPQARRAEARVRARAQRLLDLLELGEFRDTYIRELSTGLRRVVDIACVLALEPEVLLLDEPSSGISQSEAEALAPLLRRVRRETGCSLMIIEHDIPLISAVSDELVALAEGRVLIQDVPAVVLDDPRVIASYLGDSVAAVNRSGSLQQ